MRAAEGVADDEAMAGSLVGTRSPRKRLVRILALLIQIGTQLRVASQLIKVTFSVFYDFLAVACLTTAAVVIAEGKGGDAFVWGGSGVALTLGWVAAKLAKRGVASVRRALREQWNEGPARLDRSGRGDRHGPR